jgi:hypothetical protein
MVGLRVVCLMAATVVAGAQTRSFRDPQGRFSVAVPPGWNASANGDAVMLTTSGGAYGMVVVIPMGAAQQNRVAEFTDQFGRQWSAYQRVSTGAAKLGGRDGAYALYTGKNPKGVDAVVKAVSAPLGNDAVVVVIACPVGEWEQRKAAVEAIERGMTFGAAVPSTVGPPAARGARQLPTGFKVAARSGQSGQALTASFDGGKSAKATFSGLFKHVGAYFDGAPQLRAAMADRQDREIQGFFQASYQGAPVRGVMVVTVDGQKGYVGVLFDRPELFPQSVSGLSKQMAASLPQGGAGQGGGRGPARPQPLQRQQLTDGSGWIGLPAGWRITGSYKGTVDAAGPSGELVSLGGYTVAFANPMPGTQANLITGPIRPPAQAFAAYLDVTFQRALSRGIARYQVIEQAPVQSDGGQAAYLNFRVESQGKAQQGLALVSVKPVDASQWFLYCSVVSSPAERFAQELPTLWEIWKSWSVNPAVFRERMDAAIRSMRETSKILTDTYWNTQRTYDNVNTAWSQVIRGVTTVENLVTRTRHDVDTNVVDDVVRSLNEQGYNYRVVPLPELAQ